MLECLFKAWWLRNTVLCLAAGVLLSGCATTRQEKKLWEAFANLSFPSEWTASGDAPLKNGTYREPAAPEAASEIVVRLTHPIALGDLGGRASAAVVLVTEPGGSGSFYDLAVLQRRNGAWQVVDLVLLGDRIRLSALAIDEKGIQLDMIIHGPGEPMCCPTRRTRTRFVLTDGALRKTLPREAMPLSGMVCVGKGPSAKTPTIQPRQIQSITP